MSRTCLFKQSLLVLATLMTLACATPLHRSFSEIEIGDDKASIVEVLGNPKHTLRRDGKDFWVYRYYRDKFEYRRTLVFETGKLESIGSEERIADPREKLIEEQLEALPNKTPDSSFIEQ